MEIIGLETVRSAEFGNLVYVRIHTDEGLVGLGETFRNAEATEAYLHETCAPFLIGQDPLRRDALAHGMARTMGNRFNGFPTRSVEIRGNSAVDIALWDLCGQAAGVPIFQLLGGRTHESIPVYNTCAGGSYNMRVRVSRDSTVHSRRDPAPERIGPRDDLLMQVFEPARLAQELLAEGITAMKIWPFDAFAMANDGKFIRADELRDAIWPIEQIRETVGDAMDILIEYHSLWDLAPALEIARALEDFGIYWHEDPIRLHNLDDLARYKARVTPRVAGSENLGTLPWYREVFTRGAVDVANFDMAWIGGLTEGQRVAHLAHAFDRPIAPHDCTGPITLISNVHMLAAAPNALFAEIVRNYCAGFYRTIVTDLPPIAKGRIAPLTGAGLGATLTPEFLTHDDAIRRLSGRSCD